MAWIHSLWPSVDICPPRSGSTWAQVMTNKPNHYLTNLLLTISCFFAIQRRQLRSKPHVNKHINASVNLKFNIKSKFHRGWWFNLDFLYSTKLRNQSNIFLFPKVSLSFTNSMVPRRCGDDFASWLISRAIAVELGLSKCHRTTPYDDRLILVRVMALLSSGNKPLPAHMVTHICVASWRHWLTTHLFLQAWVVCIHDWIQLKISQTNCNLCAQNI